MLKFFLTPGSDAATQGYAMKTPAGLETQRPMPAHKNQEETLLIK